MLQQRRRISSVVGPALGPPLSINGNSSTNSLQFPRRHQTAILRANSLVSPITSTAEGAPSSQQQPRLSTSNRLLMQQLSVDSINTGETRQQNFGVWEQDNGSYRVHPHQRHPSRQQQFQAPINRQREIMIPGQQIQGFMTRPPQLQLSVHHQQESSQEQYGGADGDHGRSLLQQLLSE